MNRNEDLETQLKIIKLLTAILVDGNSITIVDEEEEVVTKSTSLVELIDQVNNTGQDTLKIYKDNTQQGALLLIYGNSAEELVADYSITSYTESLHSRGLL